MKKKDNIVALPPPFRGEASIKIVWIEGELRVYHGESGKLLGKKHRVDWDLSWGMLELDSPRGRK